MTDSSSNDFRERALIAALLSVIAVVGLAWWGAAHEAARTQLIGELQQRQASGQFDDLQAKIKGAQDELTQLQSHLAAGQRELEEAAAVRAQEQSEIGRQLEEARQQEAQARKELAAIIQETATKASTLAETEQRLQQARENEAAAQKQLASLSQEDEQLTASVQEAQARVTQLQQEMAKLNQDVAAAPGALGDVQKTEARLESTGQAYSGAEQIRDDAPHFFFGPSSGKHTSAARRRARSK